MTKPGVDAVERALSVLDCVRDHAEGMPLVELSRQTGFYKSTILRLAASLERFEYLTRGSDGRFRLGSSAMRLGNAYRLTLDLHGAIRIELKRLVAATGETASFYIRDGDTRVCLLRENSLHAMRHHLNEGDRLPMAGGASALVLLAFSDEKPSQFREMREAGYAISIAARDPDLAAVAVPLLTETGVLRGAIAISGPRTRFGPAQHQKALEALKVASGRLTIQL